MNRGKFAWRGRWFKQMQESVSSFFKKNECLPADNVHIFERFYSLNNVERREGELCVLFSMNAE